MGQVTAIKKVMQDRRFKNRELQIMRLIQHPNVCDLEYFYYSPGERRDEVFLNLVLEYVPETIYRANRHYSKAKQTMPLLSIKVPFFAPQANHENSFTCINSSDLFSTFTRWESATATLSLKICSWIPALVS
jgi:hypothetical protein